MSGAISAPAAANRTKIAGSATNGSTWNQACEATPANAPSITHSPTAMSTTSSTPKASENPMLIVTYRPPTRRPFTSVWKKRSTRLDRRRSLRPPRRCLAAYERIAAPGAGNPWFGRSGAVIDHVGYLMPGDPVLTDVLGSGRKCRLLGGKVAAPSTLGVVPCAAFTFGHV